MDKMFLYRLGQKRGGGSGGGGGSEEEWIGDGNTHIWVSIPENSLELQMYIAVKGTATIDWGDGTEFDTVNGLSTNGAKDLTHQYTNGGDYVVTIAVDGEAALVSGIAGYGSSINFITAVELGDAVNKTKSYAFSSLRSLEKADVSPLNNFGADLFSHCPSLRSVRLPHRVDSASTSNLFSSCSALREIILPDGITEIGTYAMYNTYALKKIVVPSSVTNISSNAIYCCESLRYIDFTRHTTVPTLSGSIDISSYCQIRVPAALVDEWKAATNWSAYGDHIVGV
jgi:hypothetical protein